MNNVLKARIPQTTRLPPTIRHPCVRRSFHPSKQTKFVDTGIVLAHDALQGVHAVTGLPWAASIPLTALLVRLMVATPLAALSKRQGNLQKELIPLLTGLRSVFRRQVLDFEKQTGKRLGPEVAEREVQKSLKVEKKRIYRKFGVKSWVHWLQLMQFPVWLSFMDALRRMCGMESIVDAFRQWYRSWTATAFREWEDPRSKSEEASAVATASGDSADVATPLVPIESSFATEGALWFPDLTVMDPALVLPFALSGALLLSINYGKTQSFDPARLAAMSVYARVRARFFRSLRLALNIFAVGIAPMSIAAGFPSGIMIYWISGSLMATLQVPLLNRLFPSQPMVQPCTPKAVVMKKQFANKFGGYAYMYPVYRPRS